MTKEEFIEGYCERSGVTYEFLQFHGRSAEPCDCDYEGCEGWQMAHVADWDFEQG